MRVLFCKIQCPSFICFCKPSAAHLYTPGPLKLENTPQVPSTIVSNIADTTNNQLPGENETIEEEEVNERSPAGNQQIDGVLKSCIRRKVPVQSKEVEKKKVQWMDNIGKELVEIREIESSNAADTYNERDHRGCMCVIL